MEIAILRVDKDIDTLTANGGEIIETVTVAVAYTANVKVGGCSIHGSFKFSDELIIMDEEKAKQKIRNLFLEKDSEGDKLIKEKDYFKNLSEFRLEIIKDLEKQLWNNNITPFSETRKKENGHG